MIDIQLEEIVHKNSPNNLSTITWTEVFETVSFKKKYFCVFRLFT